MYTTMLTFPWNPQNPDRAQHAERCFGSRAGGKTGHRAVLKTIILGNK